MPRMTRRDFAVLLGCATLSPLVAWSQPAGRKPVIGYLVLGEPEPVLSLVKDGLRRLGHIDGKTMQVELRNAQGQAERLPGLAAELVRLKVDVLVAAQTPAATAAKQATREIPIVMAGVGDPVGTGLIASLAQPGGNITGMTGITADLGGKTLELVRELMPSAKRVAVLANATDPFTKGFLDQLRSAAPAVALEVSPIMIRDAGQLSAAFPNMVKQRIDIVIVQPSLQRRMAAEMALKHRLPAFSSAGQFPAEGGLMSYAANLPDLHLQTAAYIDKILKGVRPADLPVQRPSKFDLIINLGTAKALGLSVPRSLLLRADKLIE